MESINKTLNKYLDELKKENNNTGISTGFSDLDYAIKGLDKSKLIVIASRPAMGKSNLLLNIASNVAVDEKIPVAVFNLELSKEQCIERMIAQKSLVNISNIKTNNINAKELNKVKTAVKELSEAQIYIYDTPNLSMEEIREKCIKLKNEKDIRLIVIDYLQLIQNSKDENICVSLKTLAQELNVSIIITSQLSRKPKERFEKGEDPRPILSDINTSILNESDVLIFLHRDDYYNTDSENKDIAELIIARNKFGDTGTVKLLFMKDYLKYTNLARNIEDKDIFKETKEISIKEIQGFESINTDDVKQIETDFDKSHIYILLNNKDFFINSSIKDHNVEEIVQLENDNLYEIKTDNTIIPLKDKDEWDEIDTYLYNENKPYKKIITRGSNIVCLTEDNKVVSVSFFELLGVVPENFVNVDDIYIKEGRIYIAKEGKERPLYIIGNWKE